MSTPWPLVPCGESKFVWPGPPARGKEFNGGGASILNADDANDGADVTAFEGKEHQLEEPTE
jgi:hypothetical protein